MGTLANPGGPKIIKKPALDLTSSTLFVGAFERHAAIANFARTLNVLLPFDNGANRTNLNLGAILEMFFHALHGLHTFWRQKTMFSETDLNQHDLNFSIFF